MCELCYAERVIIEEVEKFGYVFKAEKNSSPEFGPAVLKVKKKGDKEYPKGKLYTYDLAGTLAWLGFAYKYGYRRKKRIEKLYNALKKGDIHCCRPYLG